MDNPKGEQGDGQEEKSWRHDGSHNHLSSCPRRDLVVDDDDSNAANKRRHHVMSVMKDHDEWTRDGGHNHQVSNCDQNKEEEEEAREENDHLLFRVVFHKDNDTGESCAQQQTLH